MTTFRTPRRSGRRPRRTTVAGALLASALVTGCGDGPETLGDGVAVWRLPEEGRLPNVVVDDAGTVHAIYVVGPSRAGDLRYVRRAPGESVWSDPQPVNSRPGTVVGIGPIDGGQLALGRDGRLHVVWFRLAPTEFFYTRTNDTGTAFEPQFGLAAGKGVEAGPAVAADDAGNVYVFWHTGEPPDAGRAVYMAVSRDDGRTFAVARPVNDRAEGACDCCSLHARTDRAAAVYVSYRGAGENVRRGQRLLTSRDRGETFTDELLDLWEINACPISTTGLTEGPSGMAVAWETEGQVYVAPVDAPERSTAPVGQADARRRNPRAAINQRGDTLLVWGDAISWQAGGTLHWQRIDPEGRATDDHGTGPEIPDGSVPAVAAQPDGSFVVVF